MGLFGICTNHILINFTRNDHDNLLQAYIFLFLLILLFFQYFCQRLFSNYFYKAFADFKLFTNDIVPFFFFFTFVYHEHFYPTDVASCFFFPLYRSAGTGTVDSPDLYAV